MTLTADLTVKGGRVVAAQVGGPEGLDGITRCFAEILKGVRFPVVEGVRFPVVEGGTQITQPISITPRS